MITPPRMVHTIRGGDFLIGFILGTVVGGSVGVITMSLCSIAKAADEKAE